MIAAQDVRGDDFLDAIPAVVPRAGRRRRLPSAPAGRIYGAMEDRLARLETHMEHVREDVSGLKADVRDARSDIGGLRIDLTKLIARVDHLPSKGYIVTVVSIGATILAAVTLFGPNIRALFGGG